MDFEETMVEENFDEAVEDDTSFDGFVEESEDEEELSEEYSEDGSEEVPDEEEEAEPEPEQPRSEPGWIKQRVQKAVDKAVAEALAQQQAQFNEQLAPLIAKMQEDEAQELVRSRKIADIETAREFVRLKNGQAPVAKQEQPRNQQGQFASREQIQTEARIDELAKQADKIKAKGGPDVIKAFSENEDIKRRVVNGELDFYDVAEMIGKPKKRPPAPSRSPNGDGNYGSNSFMNMDSKQFARFEKNLDGGARYTIK